MEENVKVHFCTFAQPTFTPTAVTWMWPSPLINFTDFDVIDVVELVIGMSHVVHCLFIQPKCERANPAAYGISFPHRPRPRNILILLRETNG